MSAQQGVTSPLGTGWRLLSGALLVVAVSVRLAPGTLSADGSLALALDPNRFIRVALSGWSQAGAGFADDAAARQVPLAALYALGDLAGLAPWATQTILRTAVLLVAYVGGVALSRSVLGRHRLEIVAGLFVALNPVLLGRSVSSLPDALAVAVAPLVLAPLLSEARGTSARRTALASAAPTVLLGPAQLMWSAAVLMAGLLAAVSGPRPRARRSGWWLLFTGLASAWWLWAAVWGYVHRAAPAVGVSEDAWVALLRVLRLGGESWVAVLLGAALVLVTASCWHPASRRVAPLATAVLVAGAGAAAVEQLVGPLRLGPVPAPPGSALEPASTAEVLLGLGWVLSSVGLVLTLSRLTPRRPPRGTPRQQGWRAVAVAQCALLVVCATFLTRTPSEEPVAGSRLPAEWTALGTWLEGQPAGAVLVLPPARRGSARWGTSTAEPLSALTDRQWWSRTDRPLTATDSTRMLDAATSSLVRGRGSSGVGEVLRRLGIRFVVLRRDLTPRAQAEAEPRLLRQGVSSMPGWSVAASFGASSGPDLLGRSVGFGLADPGPQLEVWSTDADDQAQGYPAAATPLTAGPEAILAMADGGATASATLPWQREGVVSDATRLRRVEPSVVLDPGGATQQRRAARAQDPTARRPGAGATARFAGVTSVTSSSAASEPSSSGAPRLDSAPFAALDGNQFTAWRSAPGDVGGAWWATTFGQPIDLADASATFVDSRLLGPRVNVVRVQTEHESVLREVLPGGEVFLDLARPATRLRITVTGIAAASVAADAVGIAQVLVPGLTAERTLVLPDGGPGASWVLAPDPAHVGQCVLDRGATLCSPGLSVPGEDGGRLDRVLRTPTARSLPIAVTVRAQSGPVARRVIDAAIPSRVRATASSTFVPDPVVRPRAAVDADVRTSWLAAVDDEAPVLSLRWATRAPVSGVTLVHAATPLSSAPVRVALRTPGQRVEVRLDPTGRATFPRVVTDRLDIEVLETTRDVTVDPRTAGLIVMPVGIAEARVSGAPPASAIDLSQQVTLPCGQGPQLAIGGRTVTTSVRARAGDLLSLDEVEATPCDTRLVRLFEGENRVRVAPSLIWSPVRIVIGDLPADHGARAVSVRSMDPGSLSARLGAGASTLVASPVAAAPGWRATLNGRRLPYVVVDGWRAAWVVPTGADGLLRVQFSAGSSLRQGMTLGAVAALVPLVWLVVVAAGATRRRRRRTSRTDIDASGVDGVSRRESEIAGSSTR